MKLLKSLPLPSVILCVLAGVLLGLGLFTFWYAEGGSYFSTDPRSCMNCHVMREHYDGWQKASHHAVATCNDCHMPEDTVGKLITKAENGFWHSKGFTFQDFHEPIRIKPRNSAILQNNCVRCHSELVSEVIGHTPPSPPSEGGARGGDAAMNCVRCHSAVGHGAFK